MRHKCHVCVRQLSCSHEETSLTSWENTSARYVSASCCAAMEKHHLHPKRTQMPCTCQPAVMQLCRNITYNLRNTNARYVSVSCHAVMQKHHLPSDLRNTNARYVSDSCHAAMQKHHLHPERTQIPGMCQLAVMQPCRNITYPLMRHKCHVYVRQLLCSHAETSLTSWRTQMPCMCQTAVMQSYRNITYILRGQMINFPAKS